MNAKASGIALVDGSTKYEVSYEKPVNGRGSSRPAQIVTREKAGWTANANGAKVPAAGAVSTPADAVVLTTPVHHANLLFDQVGRDKLTSEHGVDAALFESMRENKSAGYLYDRRVSITVFLSLTEKQKAKLAALFKDGGRREFSVET